MSNLSRSARRERAYKLVVTSGTLGTIGGIGLVLAIFGVIGAGIPILLLIAAAVFGLLFKRAVD